MSDSAYKPVQMKMHAIARKWKLNCKIFIFMAGGMIFGIFCLCFIQMLGSSLNNFLAYGAYSLIFFGIGSVVQVLYTAHLELEVRLFTCPRCKGRYFASVPLFKRMPCDTPPTGLFYKFSSCSKCGLRLFSLSIQVEKKNPVAGSVCQDQL